jgi:hypothetical protein
MFMPNLDSNDCKSIEALRLDPIENKILAAANFHLGNPTFPATF